MIDLAAADRQSLGIADQGVFAVTTLATASDTGLQSYQSSGYVIARGLFTGAEVATIRDTFMEMASGGPVEGLSETMRKTGKTYSADDPLHFYPRMMQPHMHADKIVGAVSMRYLLDERVRTILRELMGEEPIAAQ